LTVALGGVAAILLAAIVVVATRGGGRPSHLTTSSPTSTSTALDATTAPSLVEAPISSTAPGPPECAKGQLTATMSLDKTDYPWQEPVVMTLAVVNASPQACSVRVAKGTSRSPTYVLYTDGSGDDIWTSTFCHHDAPALAHDVSEAWAPGHREVQHYTWSTNERRMYQDKKPVCSASVPPETDPTYIAAANWPGARPYATSNRVRFRINSGAQEASTTSSTATTSTTSTSTSVP
jgi:hypothetical protein